MTRSVYYKWLLAMYLITGIVFYKSISSAYGIEFVLAESWYRIGMVGTFLTGAIMLFINIFMLNMRFGDSIGEGKDESSCKDMRIGEYREAGSKKYSFIIIFPLLVMAVMNIQWDFVWEGLATLNIFFSVLLYQGAVNRGGDELVLDQAKAGTTKK